MKDIDPEEFKNRLINEFGYPEKYIYIAEKELKGFPEYIHRLFLEWWNTGLVPDFEIEGYTIQNTQEKGIAENPVAAFMFMSWLYRDPEKAKESLKKRSYDRVIISEEYKEFLRNRKPE